MRQIATWELGVILCQNESQGASSITAAKAVYSQAVLEAKTNYQTTVMEAKTMRCHSIQAAIMACSKAIHEAKAWKTSQTVMFQEEHSKYLQSLEEQAFGEESRICNNILSSCKATLCHSLQPLRGDLAASYHLLLGQAPPSPSPHSASKDFPHGRADIYSHSPIPTPKQSPRPKRWLPLPEPMGNTPLGGAIPVAALGGPPYPKKQENPPWFKSLKPSHAEAFLRDSNIVVEARLHFFSKHSYNFNQDGNCDLSRIFKKLAKSAALLGTDIYEIQASWTGPEELKRANYTLIHPHFWKLW